MIIIIIIIAGYVPSARGIKCRRSVLVHARTHMYIYIYI